MVTAIDLRHINSVRRVLDGGQVHRVKEVPLFRTKSVITTMIGNDAVALAALDVAMRDPVSIGGRGVFFGGLCV